MYRNIGRIDMPTYYGSKRLDHSFFQEKFYKGLVKQFKKAAEQEIRAAGDQANQQYINWLIWEGRCKFLEHFIQVCHLHDWVSLEEWQAAALISRDTLKDREYDPRHPVDSLNKVIEVSRMMLHCCENTRFFPKEFKKCLRYCPSKCYYAEIALHVMDQVQLKHSIIDKRHTLYVYKKFGIRI